MGEGRISGRQFGLLTFVMMLAPLTHAIPLRTAAAGRAGWLLILPAAVPLALLLRRLLRGLERLPPGSGLGEFYLQTLGGRWGRVCCAVSALWVLMILVADLRFSADRYVTAVYPDTGREIFCFALTALTLWIAWGSLEALTRAARILFWVVVVTFVLVLAMAASKTHIYNVWPVTDISPEEAGLSAVRLMTVLAFAVVPCFLLGSVSWWTCRMGAAIWTGALAGAAVLLGAAVFAAFGPELAGRLQMPFFALAKEISFRRTIQGMEVIVAAMWILSDTALMGVSVFALGEIGGKLFPRARKKWLRTGAVLTALVLCLLLPASSFQVDRLYRNFAMPANLAVGYGLPLAALAGGKLRRKW